MLSANAAGNSSKQSADQEFAIGSQIDAAYIPWKSRI